MMTMLSVELDITAYPEGAVTIFFRGERIRESLS